MTAEQLKASLLQMAIQGKLVPQLDDELPVDIDAEEPDEIPFAIPEKWKWVKLGECAQINPKITASDDTDVSFIPMPLLQAGFGSNIDISNIKKWKNVKKGFTKFCDNDVLLAKITPCFENRKSAIVIGAKNGIGAGTTELHVFRCKRYVLPEYLLYFFKTPYLIYFGVQHFKGTAGQQRIGSTEIKNCPFPLPPLAEQRRIVAYLSALLPLVEKYGKSQRAVQALETKLPDKLRASLLQQAIMGKLVPQLDDEPTVDIDVEAPEEVPFAIPEKWKWVRLHDIGTIVSGATPKTNVTEYWSPATVPWITPADLGKNKKKTISCGERFISMKGYQSCSAVLLPKGSVVYSSRAPIGHIAIAENELATNQGCKSISPNFQIVLSEYIYYALIALTSDIQSRASGTTFLEISGKKLGDTLFPLPPLAEQRRIVTSLNELLPYMNSMRNNKWQN